MATKAELYSKTFGDALSQRAARRYEKEQEKAYERTVGKEIEAKKEAIRQKLSILYNQYLSNPNYIVERDAQGNITKIYSKPQEYVAEVVHGQPQRSGTYSEHEIRFEGGKAVSESYYGLYSPTSVSWRTTTAPYVKEAISLGEGYKAVTTYGIFSKKTTAEPRVKEYKTITAEGEETKEGVLDRLRDRYDYKQDIREQAKKLGAPEDVDTWQEAEKYVAEKEPQKAGTGDKEIAFYMSPEGLKTYRVGGAPAPKGYTSISGASYNLPKGQVTKADAPMVLQQLKASPEAQQKKVEVATSLFAKQGKQVFEVPFSNLGMARAAQAFEEAPTSNMLGAIPVAEDRIALLTPEKRTMETSPFLFVPLGEKLRGGKNELVSTRDMVVSSSPNNISNIQGQTTTDIIQQDKGLFEGFIKIPKMVYKGLIELYKPSKTDIPSSGFEGSELYTTPIDVQLTSSITSIKEKVSKPEVQSFLMASGLVAAPSIVSIPLGIGFTGLQIGETIKNPTKENIGTSLFIATTWGVSAITSLRGNVKTATVGGTKTTFIKSPIDLGWLSKSGRRAVIFTRGSQGTTTSFVPINVVGSPTQIALIRSGALATKMAGARLTTSIGGVASAVVNPFRIFKFRAGREITETKDAIKTIGKVVYESGRQDFWRLQGKATETKTNIQRFGVMKIERIKGVTSDFIKPISTRVEAFKVFTKPKITKAIDEYKQTYGKPISVNILTKSIKSKTPMFDFKYSVISRNVQPDIIIDFYPKKYATMKIARLQGVVSDILRPVSTKVEAFNVFTKPKITKAIEEYKQTYGKPISVNILTKSIKSKTPMFDFKYTSITRNVQPYVTIDFYPKRYTTMKIARLQGNINDILRPISNRVESFNLFIKPKIEREIKLTKIGIETNIESKIWKLRERILPSKRAVTLNKEFSLGRFDFYSRQLTILPRIRKGIDVTFKDVNLVLKRIYKREARVPPKGYWFPSREEYISALAIKKVQLAEAFGIQQTTNIAGLPKSTEIFKAKPLSIDKLPSNVIFQGDGKTIQILELEKPKVETKQKSQLKQIEKPETKSIEDVIAGQKLKLEGIYTSSKSKFNILSTLYQTPKSKLKQKQVQLLKQAQKQGQQQTQGQSILQLQAQGQTVSQAQAVSQLLSQGQTQSQGQAVLQTQAQSQSQGQTQQQSTTEQITEQIETPDIIRLPEPQPSDFLQKARVKRLKQQGYDVLIKAKQEKLAKGKYKSRGYTKANEQALTREAALGLGAGIVDRYTNRSFTIRKAKTNPVERRDLEQQWDRIKNKFRAAKKKANIITEKTNYAIDSFEEKRDIPYESLRLRKAGLLDLKKKKQKIIGKLALINQKKKSKATIDFLKANKKRLSKSKWL